ncbi:aldo/keto reductase [Paenibacillus hamazuiensis]|uniref:aldo/keto reductase n=1 Tax=Paenibacillus hamazuiensis TaxID=2936508 RepID=UPI00200E7414|nr:aldo/keto reductase [Paenibacillus hamazuiensis]
MLANIAGQATQEGTARWAGAHPSVSFHRLGRTGLMVSAAGFGSYRVDASVEAHREALRHSLERGINLIDTSANYADGGSERLIGQVLAEQIGEGRLSREHVVIVSKAGYLQGENYRLSAERKRAGRPFPELVEYAEGLEHCIHPEFLEDQLTRSLERLQLDTIDVYLLHNPEYYLNWAGSHGVSPAAAREEYLRRIEAAFRHLESEADRGRIGCYGISSNTFPSPAGFFAHTPLDAIWDIAERISPNHRFRCIQLPANLLETGAFTERNQRGGLTAAEFAQQHELAVLVNRPLNAYRGHRLTRLADVPESPPVGEGDVEAALERLRELEQELARGVLPRAGLAAAPVEGGELLRRWHAYGAHAVWMHSLRGRIVPAVQQAMAPLLRLAPQHAELARWSGEYTDVMNRAFRLITLYYQQAAREEAAAIRARAEAADADWRAAGSLSRLAVRALRSTAGVGSVLVGMRSTAYVDDVLAELQQPVEARDRAASWERLRQSLDGEEGHV